MASMTLVLTPIDDSMPAIPPIFVVFRCFMHKQSWRNVTDEARIHTGMQCDLNVHGHFDVETGAVVRLLSRGTTYHQRNTFAWRKNPDGISFLLRSERFIAIQPIYGYILASVNLELEGSLAKYETDPVCYPIAAILRTMREISALTKTLLLKQNRVLRKPALLGSELAKLDAELAHQRTRLRDTTHRISQIESEIAVLRPEKKHPPLFVARSLVKRAAPTILDSPPVHAHYPPALLPSDSPRSVSSLSSSSLSSPPGSSPIFHPAPLSYSLPTAGLVHAAFDAANNAHLPPPSPQFEDHTRNTLLATPLTTSGPFAFFGDAEFAVPSSALSLAPLSSPSMISPTVRFSPLTPQGQ